MTNPRWTFFAYCNQRPLLLEGYILPDYSLHINFFHAQLHRTKGIDAWDRITMDRRWVSGDQWQACQRTIWGYQSLFFNKITLWWKILHFINISSWTNSGCSFAVYFNIRIYIIRAGNTSRTGARFTNGFLPAIQIRWKLRLSITPLLAIRSQQIFARATTAQLSCHVQNFVELIVLELRWGWNEIFIEFQLRWKKR